MLAGSIVCLATAFIQKPFSASVVSWDFHFSVVCCLSTWEKWHCLRFLNLWCVSTGMCLIFWLFLLHPSCKSGFQGWRASQYLSPQGNVGEILGTKGAFLQWGWSGERVEEWLALKRVASVVICKFHSSVVFAAEFLKRLSVCGWNFLYSSKTSFYMGKKSVESFLNKLLIKKIKGKRKRWSL